MLNVRLKEERERLKLSQTALGELVGAAKRTVIDWEKGVSSPTAVQLSTLSEHGADAAYIITGERTAKPSTVLMSANDMVYIPRYDVRASAGGGQLVGEEMIVDHMAFKQEWLNKMRLQRDQLALIEVHGDSMEPALKNTDIILIDLRANHLSANAIYVIQHNGHLLVKRLQAKLDGTVVIKSDNHHYDPEFLTAEEAANLTVVGRVVWYGRGM